MVPWGPTTCCDLHHCRALAKLEHSCPELMDGAMQHVLHLTHEYTPQSDANMLWCASLCLNKVHGLQRWTPINL